MKYILSILMCILNVNIFADARNECTLPLDTSDKAKECAMWYSRVISELSVLGYKHEIVEEKQRWIVRHTNLDKNSSTYKVIVNRSDGILIEMSHE